MGAKYEKIHHTNAPPILILFKLHQYNVSLKITIVRKIYDYENENTAQSKKILKSQF